MHLARGEINEALSAIREALKLEVERPRTETQATIKYLERLVELDGRLDTIVRGRDIPAKPTGKIEHSEVCRVRCRFAAAAQFYRDAFRATPELADDLESQNRLHAAIASAQAASSQNRDDANAPLDDAQRSRWRTQALTWGRAEADTCAKFLTPGRQSRRALARKTLEILTHHRDLACVREEIYLKELREDERRAWQEFWGGVRTLIKRAEIDNT